MTVISGVSTPYTMQVQLCDQEGMVSDEPVVPGSPGTVLDPHLTYVGLLNNLRAATGLPPYEGPPMRCTGSAHLAREHIECTNPRHHQSWKQAPTVISGGSHPLDPAATDINVCPLQPEQLLHVDDRHLEPERRQRRAAPGTVPGDRAQARYAASRHRQTRLGRSRRHRGDQRMSTCISSHGEFGSHTLDPLHYCSLCGVLDEDTLRADLRSAKVEASNYAYQRDEARRERDKLNTELAEEKRRTKAQLAERQKDYSKTLKESAAEVERLTSELAEANERAGRSDARHLKASGEREEIHGKYLKLLLDWEKLRERRDLIEEHRDSLYVALSRMTNAAYGLNLAAAEGSRVIAAVNGVIADKSAAEQAARADAAHVIGRVVEALVSDCSRCGGLDGTHTVRNCAGERGEIDESSVNAVDEIHHPCQPIGCDNGYHLHGCVFAEVDAELDPVREEQEAARLDSELADINRRVAADKRVLDAAKAYVEALTAGIETWPVHLRELYERKTAEADGYERAKHWAGASMCRTDAGRAAGEAIALRGIGDKQKALIAAVDALVEVEDTPTEDLGFCTQCGAHLNGEHFDSCPVADPAITQPRTVADHTAVQDQDLADQLRWRIDQATKARIAARDAAVDRDGEVER